MNCLSSAMQNPFMKKKFKGNIFLDGNVESMDHLFQVLIKYLSYAKLYDRCWGLEEGRKDVFIVYTELKVWGWIHNYSTFNSMIGG